MEDEPPTAWDEFKMAIAGPVVQRHLRHVFLRAVRAHAQPGFAFALFGVRVSGPDQRGARGIQYAAGISPRWRARVPLDHLGAHRQPDPLHADRLHQRATVRGRIHRLWRAQLYLPAAARCSAPTDYGWR